MHVVLAHADARVVAMAVRDHRARHGPPGIDVEIAGRAVQAFGRRDRQVGGTGQDTTVRGARLSGRHYNSVRVSAALPRLRPAHVCECNSTPCLSVLARFHAVIHREVIHDIPCYRPLNASITH